MKLYVNVEAQSPQTALVVADDAPDWKPADALVLGDKITVELYLVKATGELDERSGDASQTLRMAVGELGSNPIALTTSWTADTDHFTGLLNLNATEAHEFLAEVTEQSRAVVLEIELADADGNVDTILQAETQLRREIISGEPDGSIDETPYPNLRYVQNRSTITALTGGTATALDGIATLGMSTGTLVAVVISGSLFHYKLTTGTDAESAPSVIRPDDYATTTNEKVWKLVGVTSLWKDFGTYIAPTANPNVWIGDKRIRIEEDSFNMVDMNPAGTPTGATTVYNFDTTNEFGAGDVLASWSNVGQRQFCVNANSGYTGTGTLFLADDGNYYPVTGVDTASAYTWTGAHTFNAPVRHGHETVSYASSLAIDFDGKPFQSITLTGALSITTANRGDGTTIKSVVVRLIAGASNRTLTFDSNIKFVGYKPSNIIASKIGILSLTSYGSTESDTVASYAEEP